MNPSDKYIADIYSFGATPIAYVRPVITEQGKNYGVYTADGTQLAVFSTEDAAYFAAKQHDLEPVLIH
jgi:hypothetical protein